MQEKWRLFWAVPLPASLRRQLVEVQRELGFSPRSVKWVEEENLHLTVRFLGDTEAGQVDPLREAVAARLTSIKAFSLEVEKLGAFPSLKHPRVIWVGVKAHPSLFLLYQAVEEAVRGLGFAPATQPFSPHITLGRVRERAVVPGDHRWAERSYTFTPFLVDELVLYRSFLTPRGPIYSRVAAVRLSGA
ncbi:2'-5' RNA ligase [Ammonifex degensii KC4]|uniref:RNA 2',3'-cyclic phosphodiesterase n=1 Tax=Ammonifex degensii (strain DSM 10501 / KC4) TaxID=429009 RepID=C9R942_AMMDK|nr:RNA 2',3'-cyclic phosphodiesterase [Ammonifex degensii]ACX52821.1 2'-5' RNA ligase [Ammonifex degensii KC4]